MKQLEYYATGNHNRIKIFANHTETGEVAYYTIVISSKAVHVQPDELFDLGSSLLELAEEVEKNHQNLVKELRGGETAEKAEAEQARAIKFALNPGIYPDFKKFIQRKDKKNGNR